MSATTITFVLGTRPEIIKLAPLIRACSTQGVPFEVIHTGQHYSEELDTVFFDQLSLPVPDHNLEVGSDSHGRQTGRMTAGIEAVVEESAPKYVVVQGDTNSTLAGALVASKRPTTLCHVEAGLRSFDREMPEETNRVLADHASDVLFPPTEQARDHLEAEGIPDERILVTGNTVVDALVRHRELAADSSTVLERFGLDRGSFLALTVHRAENVDDGRRFQRVLDGVGRAADRFGMPVVYPAHPRATERIERDGLSVPESIRVVEPLDYLDFLTLEDAAALVFTDSGGVQEETCVLGTPCVTLRDSTERPETVEVGSNSVVGTVPDDIVEGAKAMLDANTDWTNPFGDGDAAGRILDYLLGPGELMVDRR